MRKPFKRDCKPKQFRLQEYLQIISYKIFLYLTSYDYFVKQLDKICKNLHNSCMDIAEKLLEEIAVIAARRNDRELLMAIRRKLAAIDKELPDVAQHLSRAIASASGLGGLRKFKELDAIPLDEDSGMELLIIESNPKSEVSPIIPSDCRDILDRFLKERANIPQLRSAGVRPPSSLALMGLPGTGKTTIARWIAEKLNLPLMILNLASVITSYLGQTGLNLKKALDRARLEPSLLLLDEFDALGRSRIEGQDVGEMKRVVTVLLQEIERWPDHSVLVMATNLPELVDIAFRRRFSRWILLPLPDEQDRLKIFNVHYKGRKIQAQFQSLVKVSLEGFSGADIASFANRVTSRQIIDNISATQSIIDELETELPGRNLSDDTKKRFIQIARKINKKRFTYRYLGQKLNVSHTTVMNWQEEMKHG